MEVDMYIYYLKLQSLFLELGIMFLDDIINIITEMAYQTNVNDM